MSRSRTKIGCLPVIIILMVAGYMRGAKNGPAARPLAPEQHQVAQAEAPAARSDVRESLGRLLPESCVHGDVGGSDPVVDRGLQCLSQAGHLACLVVQHTLPDTQQSSAVRPAHFNRSQKDNNGRIERLVSTVASLKPSLSTARFGFDIDLG